jgi:cytochrome c oxidase subunit III
MATLTTTASVGGSGIFTGGYDRPNDGSRDYGARLRRARLGMCVAVVAIVMVFISLTSAYVVRQGLPTLDARTGLLVRDWFPLQLPKLLLVNTVVLLISSLTMELSRRQVAREAVLTQVASIPGVSLERTFRIPWLAYTVVLGLCFLAGQWLVWRELAVHGFYMSTNPSSSFFYLLTGMHGMHLIGGILALSAAGAASVLRKPVETRSVVLDVTGWYWHFMAFLWVYIFCLLEFSR